MDTRPEDSIPEWHRIAFNGSLNVEGAHRFSRRGAGLELSEARMVWSRFHDGQITNFDLVRALNDRPGRSPVQRVNDTLVVQVLDWGTWAAFHQRPVCHSLTSISYRLWLLADRKAQAALPTDLAREFDRLTLYPVVLRWIADTSTRYEEALKTARVIAETAPELLTAAAWNYLLAKPHFGDTVGAFPLEVAWFTPAVPDGTTFDLASRSLRAGCPRPPTLAQSRVWAAEMPYDHWTLWAQAYFAVDRGSPSYAVVRSAFGSLLEYDEAALLKAIDYLEMNVEERLTLSRSLCAVSPSRCPRLAELLLLEDREIEAVKVYERWITKARDSVGVANEMTWLARYYFEHGNVTRAETIARMAADTGSAGGLEVLGECLDRSEQYADAEAVYRRIVERYPHRSPTLGTFLMRQALRAGDATLEAKAGELLRPSIPTGLQRVAMHALPVQLSDGVMFGTFGKRAAAAGLKATDVIVGIDEWRVRNLREYTVATRLSHHPAMTLTIWRDGRYRQLRVRVPQRWFGCRFRDVVRTS